MKNRLLICLSLLCLTLTVSATPADSLETGFKNPPGSARPWVYWFWVNSNVTREGITADLEAMERVGVGGVLLMDVDQGVPQSKIRYMDEQWQAMFVHAVLEAKRLGLEFNFNNCAGWTGSSGVSIPPDQAMQKVISSEVYIQGGRTWSGSLAKPSKAPEYRDIAVLAVAEPKLPAGQRYQIENLASKSVAWEVNTCEEVQRDLNATAPAEACVPLDKVVDLTARFGRDGTLAWDVPPGEWTILRIGQAWTGAAGRPVVKDQRGPEVDKLSKAAIALHFNAYVKRLVTLAGPEAKGTLVATHIDSWECGGQNWTPLMREEFKKRRGYDIVPYLPILTGRVLGDLQTSERFLYDLRKTVSELLIENYTAEFQRLARANGLRNTFESYHTIGNDQDNADVVDEPMAEFWVPTRAGRGPMKWTGIEKAMSSAAHINGRSIVAAEAFTGDKKERWLWHPATIKTTGDSAFCAGINRFVVHRYTAQPFGDAIKPGVQMGQWGLHYDRHNTWWEFTRPWHEYLARCQYLLRQGTFVADVLKLESEEPTHRFQTIPLTGYDYDGCGPAGFLRATVRDGKIVFPSGASYSMMMLPGTPVMSVELLAHIRDMVQAGAVILGDPPQQTPSLTDHDKADADLQKIVAEVWGACSTPGEHTFGKGRVFRGTTPEKVLAALDIAPDFASDAEIGFVHRKTDAADIYFLSHAGDKAVVANCRFRVKGKTPQLWDPETGSTKPLWAWSSDGKACTSASIPFEANGSAFIVFAPSGATDTRLVRATWNGAPVVDNGLCLAVPAGAAGNINLLRGELRDAGSYVFTTADGKTRQFTVSPLPATTVVGPWQLRFPVGWGAPPQLTLDELIPWDRHPDSGVKYFSGTATYAKTLSIAACRPDQRIYLDLGKVQVMARVRLNGKDLGILWKPPYRMDITAKAKPGENALEIDVVNLWVNRFIGDEQLPEDSKRNGKGAIEAWPDWLLAGKSSPAGRLAFTTFRLWGKDDSLQESGLIGPVTLSTVQHIELQGSCCGIETND